MEVILKNFLNNTLLGIMLIMVICLNSLGVIGIPKTNWQSNDGFLTFEMKSLKLEMKVFEIELIWNIGVSNDDWYGKIVASWEANFGNPRSETGHRFYKAENFLFCELKVIWTTTQGESISK
jgi:hypothetical protein